MTALFIRETIRDLNIYNSFFSFAMPFRGQRRTLQGLHWIKCPLFFLCCIAFLLFILDTSITNKYLSYTKGLSKDSCLNSCIVAFFVLLSGHASFGSSMHILYTRATARCSVNRSVGKRESEILLAVLMSNCGSHCGNIVPY